MSDVGGDVLAIRWIEPYDVPVTIPFLLLFRGQPAPVLVT